MSLLELFVDVDDFCQDFELWASRQPLPEPPKRGSKPRLAVSEIMTIVIRLYQQGFRDFKSFCQKHVCKHLSHEFPELVSYSRFIELMPRVMLVLCAYLQRRFGSCTGIAFVDSTPLAVCHNRRIERHRVFRDLAARGKSTMGRFYGFKLHRIVNELGELLAVHLTPGNIDDRNPLAAISEDLFGNKGYLSQALFETLFERGLELVTTVRKNIKS